MKTIAELVNGWSHHVVRGGRKSQPTQRVGRSRISHLVLQVATINLHNEHIWFCHGIAWSSELQDLAAPTKNPQRTSVIYYLQFPQYILKKILVIVTTFNRHIGLCKNAGRFTLWNWPSANAKKCRLGDCTGISSHLGAKLRDWADRQAEAGPSATFR